MKKYIILLILSSFIISPSVQAINTDNWLEVFDGYGDIKIARKKIVLEPEISTCYIQTHSALVIGPWRKYPYNYRVTVKTKEQLRQNSEPNPWEVGWVIWNYTDNDHFYYFIPKPNGWELGKRDPSYPGGQRFLATGSDKLFPINKEYRVKVVQRKKTSKVYVDGKKIVEFKDKENTYYKGALGVYTEDAKVKFSNIKNKRLNKK